MVSEGNRGLLSGVLWVAEDFIEFPVYSSAKALALNHDKAPLLYLKVYSFFKVFLLLGIVIF